MALAPSLAEARALFPKDAASPRQLREALVVCRGYRGYRRLYGGYIGFSRDNGKENGNYYRV